MSFDALRNKIETIAVKEESTFKTKPSTAYSGEVLTVGALGVCTDTLLNPVIEPGTLNLVSISGRVATDDGKGTITGQVVAGGTINYTTGALNFTYDDAGVSTGAGTAAYSKIGTDADVLYLAGYGQMNEAPEVVENNLVTSTLNPGDNQNTFWAGDITLPLEFRLNELSTSSFNFVGANGLVIDNFFGADSVYIAHDVLSVATSSTVVEVTGASSKWQKGDLLCVKNTNGQWHTQYEVVPITNVTGDVITVSPGFSATPAVGNLVLASRQWRMGAAGSDPACLYFHLFCGDVLWQQCGGQRVNQLQLGMTTGGLITLQANAKGAGKLAAPAEATNPFTPADQSTTGKQPLVGVKCRVAMSNYVGTGADYCRVLSATMNLSNEIFTPNVIDCEDDTVAHSIRGKYTVEGTVEEFVVQRDEGVKFQLGTKGSVLLVAGDGALNTFAAYCGRVHITGAPIADEGEEKKYQLAYKAEVPILGTTPARANDSLVRFAVFGRES